MISAKCYESVCVCVCARVHVCACVLALVTLQDNSICCAPDYTVICGLSICITLLHIIS
jgi:hypothetical protein